MRPKAQRVLALLSYLAVEADRPHSRATLARLFWPDKSRQRAFQDLRQTICRLRTLIGDRSPTPDWEPLSSRQTRLPYLLVDTQTVQFNYQSDYWLDVQAFGDQLAKVEDHGHLELDACSYLSPVVKAGELYRGEFLANFHPTGSRSLDEWLLGWREHLQRQASIIFQALAEFHFFHGELEQAQCYAQRVLHLDPWNEATHRLLLRVLLLSQGRGAAVQYHHDFREALCTELGIEPEHETLALVNHIRRHGKV